MRILILILDIFLYVAVSPAHKVSFSHFPLRPSLAWLLLDASSDNAAFTDIMRPSILSLLVVLCLILVGVRVACRLQEVPIRVQVQYGESGCWLVTFLHPFLGDVEDCCCPKFQFTPLYVATPANGEKLCSIIVAYYLESIVGVFTCHYEYPTSVDFTPIIQLLI